MKNNDKQSNLINSIIGEGARFNGEIKMSGLLRIDGDFTGTIDITGKVLIGRTGRTECNIYADTVVIGGVVKGDVYSNGRVFLLSTGMVIGNIHAANLIVEEGVIIQGICVVNNKKNYDPKDAHRILGREYKPNWNKHFTYSSNGAGTDASSVR